MTPAPAQKKIAQEPRDLDPNVRQRKASDPERSVWVNASAGTGKTKVLTDRVLRLLLPREDGRPGTPPHKILCLTFTKAGASEMELRIHGTLSRWAVQPEKKLREELETLFGRNPEASDVTAARQLFAQVVDTEGGLKIMTLHSFCQSVLGRFPLEAGLPPYFTALEEGEAEELLAESRRRILGRIDDNKADALTAPFLHIAETLNEDQFSRLLKSITAERRQLLRLLEHNFGLDGLYTAICKTLDIPPGLSPENILQDACSKDGPNEPDLLRACTAMAAGNGKKEQEAAPVIQNWLGQNPENRIALFEEYRSCFLTAKNQPRTAGFPTKKTAESLPECTDILRSEAARLLEIDERMKRAECAGLTRDLIMLALAVIDEYTALKTEKAALDFDDLIFETLDLLRGHTHSPARDGSAAWVLYKLDQGMEHILIDEAQDTNPEQWEIIEALAAEFFAGIGAHEEKRTVFTVGDEKQSIYSFQRASPEEFSRMRKKLAGMVKNAGETFKTVALNISFRSAKSVLQAVDTVFASPAMRKGVSYEDVTHHAYRTGEAGLVEVWPLFEAEETDALPPWSPPVDIHDPRSGAAGLAEHIAETLQNWFESKEILQSENRPIKPGDIMILMRTRTGFVPQLARALKQRNIPVSGVDRMILTKELVVEDLKACAEFALLPQDDLTLACVLKSPLIGMDEDVLYALAEGREGALWAVLEKSAHTDIYQYLSSLIRLSGRMHPYEFFNTLLQMPCPGDEISGRRAIKSRLGHDVLDPLDEFFETILNFERHHTPSLQHFINWLSHEEIEVKRELSEHSGEVRIMTVHGAKGLQAPIVILPDTTRIAGNSPNRPDERFLWPQKTGLDVPLWAPRKDDEPGLYQQTAQTLKDRADEEYRRLLYVAMTRAEDRLYIGGYREKQALSPGNWYESIYEGLQNLPDTQTQKDGTLRLENPQTRPAKTPEKTPPEPKEFAETPAWLFENAPEEPDPPAPLRPSRPVEEEPAALSPLQPENKYRFRRGNLTHKLLEILPEMPAENRAGAAGRYLERYGADLPPDVLNNILQETLAILDNEDYASLFGPDSVAEAPLTGLLPDGRLISGQIDRLVVEPCHVRIIDYKTNRPPPQKEEDIPLVYKNQLRAYADTLRQIYPDKTVECYLLWTDGPRLMRVRF